MSFSREVLSLLVIAALGLSVLAVFLLASLRTRRRSAGLPAQTSDAAAEQHAEAIGELRAAAGRLAEADARLRAHLAATVQRVGLVRFDAFEDMGGRLSFALALLDERGNGVVWSAINGRQDTRVYAKPVTSGASPHNLSDEETEAIRQAMAGSPAVDA